MNKTFIPALIIVGLLAFLHFTGMDYSLYVKVWWYDIMMHILGGIGIAFSIYWFLITFLKKTPSFWTIVSLTFLAGLVWEGMETYYDIAGGPVGSTQYYVDTIKDLINDTLGAIVATYLIFRK